MTFRLGLARNISLLFDVILLGAGIALLLIGGYLLLPLKTAILESSLAVALLTFGGLIILCSLLSCLGISNNSRFIMFFYVVLLVLLIAGEIALGTYGYLRKDSAEHDLNHWWQSAYDGNRKPITDAEVYFDCCGFYNTTDRAIPLTCGVDRNVTEGCYEKFINQVNDNTILFGSSIVAVTALQLLSLLFACWFIAILGSRRKNLHAINVEEVSPLIASRREE
ncbi:hypothetical protein MP228_007769 [Amoeboaphelidium protococcarum]|nr:hypothetical protein MP228_007769 [Amoeboaphelidium protococcarum]